MKNSADAWVQRLLTSRHALILLFFASMAEAIIVPIPIELILVPYMVARPEHLWSSAAVTFLGCLTSSLIGYGVGFAFFESVGRWFIGIMGYEQHYEGFREFFTAYGFYAIVLIGLVPIPFQIAMLGAGSIAYPLHLFVLATLLARGARYFLLAALVAAYGARVRSLWARSRALTIVGMLAMFALLAAGMRVIGTRLV